LKEKESKWNETEKRMELNAANFPTLVNMNVGMCLLSIILHTSNSFSNSSPFFFKGGQRFTTTKDVLLKHKGSYFELMILTDHSQQVNGE
jgi:hypothetical protein